MVGPIFNGTASSTSDEALVDASKNGHLDTVRLLLENGADPDAPNKEPSGRSANRAVENATMSFTCFCGSDLSKNLDTLSAAKDLAYL